MKLNKAIGRISARVLMSAATGALVGLSACGAGGSSGSGVLNAKAAAIQDGATSTDPNHLSLAVRFVSYVDDTTGEPVMSGEGIHQLTREMNQILRPCNLSYIAETIELVRPGDVGLPFNLASMSDLTPARERFDLPSELVVIYTGAWNHGTMGAGNAWTTLPGTSPSGAVVEEPVATSAVVVAHELGHYLSLDHVDDPANLLNPISYETSTELTQQQCQAMRNAAQTVRSGAIRNV